MGCIVRCTSCLWFNPASLLNVGKTLQRGAKELNTGIKTHPGMQPYCINILPPIISTHTHTYNSAAVIISTFSQKQQKHKRSRFHHAIRSWERTEAGFRWEQNLWTVHFVCAGPLSAPLSLGGCLVVLSLSQTITTACLCWICTHAAGLWLRHKHNVNR